MCSLLRHDEFVGGHDGVMEGESKRHKECADNTEPGDEHLYAKTRKERPGLDELELG